MELAEGRKKEVRNVVYKHLWRWLFPADTPTIKDPMVGEWQVRGVHQILSQHFPSIWQFPVVTLQMHPKLCVICILVERQR